MTNLLECFGAGVHEKLKSYVYTLIDPRDGRTFYVGKGKGDRVFQHVKGALEIKGDATLPTMIEMIREMIEIDRLEPIHVILRHGLTDNEAFAVEAALIDYIPGLVNQIGGHRTQLGPANATQLNQRYATDEIERLPGHKLMYIKTKRETVSGQGSIYKATRSAWKVDPNRANKIDYVLSIIDGLCEAVFVNCEWHRLEKGGRSKFTGQQLEIDHEISKYYIKKLAPQNVRNVRNPIRYDDQ